MDTCVRGGSNEIPIALDKKPFGRRPVSLSPPRTARGPQSISDARKRESRGRGVGRPVGGQNGWTLSALPGSTASPALGLRDFLPAFPDGAGSHSSRTGLFWLGGAALAGRRWAYHRGGSRTTAWEAPKPVIEYPLIVARHLVGGRVGAGPDDAGARKNHGSITAKEEHGHAGRVSTRGPGGFSGGAHLALGSGKQSPRAPDRGSGLAPIFSTPRPIQRVNGACKDLRIFGNSSLFLRGGAAVRLGPPSSGARPAIRARVWCSPACPVRDDCALRHMTRRAARIGEGEGLVGRTAGGLAPLQGTARRETGMATTTPSMRCAAARMGHWRQLEHRMDLQFSAARKLRAACAEGARRPSSSRPLRPRARTDRRPRG